MQRAKPIVTVGQKHRKGKTLNQTQTFHVQSRHKTANTLFPLEPHRFRCVLTANCHFNSRCIASGLFTRGLYWFKTTQHKQRAKNQLSLKQTDLVSLKIQVYKDLNRKHLRQYKPIPRAQKDQMQNTVKRENTNAITNVWQMVLTTTNAVALRMLRLTKQLTNVLGSLLQLMHHWVSTKHPKRNKFTAKWMKYKLQLKCTCSSQLYCSNSCTNKLLGGTSIFPNIVQILRSRQNSLNSACRVPTSDT